MKSFYDKFTVCRSPEGDAGAGGGTSVSSGDGQSSGSTVGGSSANNSGGSSVGLGSSGGTQAGPLLDATGNFTKDWTKALGVSDALGTKFTSPQSLAKSYESLEKMIQAKGIIKPSATASPEEKEAYLNNFRPASAKEYGYDKPIEKIMVDGKEVAVPKELYDGASVSKFTEEAYKLGFSKEQVDFAVKFDLMRGMGAKASFDKLMGDGKAAGETALKQAWGKDFEANLKEAQRAATELGMTQEEMADPSIGNNPAFLKAMAKAAAMTRESPAAGARGSETQFNGDPRKEANRLLVEMVSPEGQQLAKTDPAAHKAKVARRMELMKQANGE